MTVNNTTDKDLKYIKGVFDSVVHNLNKKNKFVGLKCNWGTVSMDGDEKPAASRTPSSRSQYNNAVFFFRFLFKEGITFQNEDVIGLHIMPYCITQEDIEKANNSKDAKFNDQKPGYIDLDKTDVFNFHKRIDSNAMRFQVVLVKAFKKKVKRNGLEKIVVRYGPGKHPTALGKRFFGAKPEDKLKCIKTDWYFPHVDAEDVEFCKLSNTKQLTEWLEKDLEDALHELGISK